MSGIRIKDLLFKSNPSPEDLLVIHDESSGEERKIPLGLTDIGENTLSQNSIWVGSPLGVPAEKLVDEEVLTWLGDPTSTNLSSTLDEKTGTGDLVFGTDPELKGTPTAPTPTLDSPSTQIATVGWVETTLEGVEESLTYNSIWVGDSSGVPTEKLINGSVLTWLGDPTSANLSSTLDEKTGTGGLVFETSPELKGTPTAPTPTLDSPSTQIATVGLLTTRLKPIAEIPVDTTYTLSNSYTGGILLLNSNTTVSVFVPLSLEAGWNITIVQSGTGRLQFLPEAGSGITIHHPDGHNKTRKMYSQVSLFRIDPYRYVLSGDTDG